MIRSLPVSLVLTASFLLGACDRGAGDSADKAPADAKPAADAKAPAGDAAQPTDASATGGDAAKPADASAAADAGKPAAGPTKEPTAKPNAFKPPTREELTEKKQSLQSHLDAGRKAVKAKDYETGIAELEKAVAINPLHAKSLGELGWAYFNAGKLDEAQDRLERGIKYADNDGTRGAILYNLGRVAEAKGDKTLAIELYTRSLAVRPNDTVSARLTSLGGTPPAVGVVTADTHSECGFTKAGAPAANLCWALLAERGQDVNDPSADQTLKCEYGRTMLDGSGAAGGEVTAYDVELDGGKVKATVFSYLDYDMFDETFILSIVIDDVLYTAPLLWVSHPGVGYADENLDKLTIRTEDLIPGGRPELVLEWSIQGHDMDPGIESEELWSSQHVAVVSVDGSEPKWLAALTSERESSWGPMTSWAGEDIDVPEGETETAKKAVSVSWGDGKVTVTADGEASAPVGSFAIGEYPQRCPAEL